MNTDSPASGIPALTQSYPFLPISQDHLDAGVAASAFATAHFPTLRAALRCVRTLLGTFHCQLGAGAGPLVQSLLSGALCGGEGREEDACVFVGPTKPMKMCLHRFFKSRYSNNATLSSHPRAGLQAGQPNFQRVAVLHAVVLLLGDGPLLAWLGTKYDHDKVGLAGWF